MNPIAWRRYNVFLSSTFKDMDFERDIIKFHVIPALNRRFRDRRVEIQAIDLRLGVNTANMTEEESERKVLSVCTSCIDSARPFFIGLLGRRYGWIPPVERWKEFIGRLTPAEQELLSGTAGCSVTEMEIVYGALSQDSFDSSHVLFYLRDDASYEGMPADKMPVFCDSDPTNLQRLEALKAKVRDLFGERAGEDDRCTEYRLRWQDGNFEGTEFERIVTEQLARRIDLETAREETEGATTWWAREKALEESTLLRLLPGSVEWGLEVDDEGMDDEEYEAALQDDSADRVVWYLPGLGASTAMAQDYSQWDGDEEVVRLLAVFGLSEYSTSMRPVLARWIHELATVCAEDDLPSDEQLLGKMPAPQLYDMLGHLVDRVRDDGKYIYLYLDDVEALETTSAKDLYMPWLDRISEKVNIYVNLQDESEARVKFLEAHPYPSRKTVSIPADEEEAEAFISHYEKEYFLELPVAIRQDMCEVAAGDDELLYPVKVHSLFRIFESLTQEDFARIRAREGSQIDAINGYLQELWEEMPSEPYDVMTFMVNTIAGNLDLGEPLRQAIWTIAAAPSGLRERDIAHFAGDDWDEVQFHRAMNFLQDYFYEDRSRHLWRARYLTMPEDGLQKRQRDISAYLLTLDKGDSLRETMGLYYALKGGDPAHFAPYLVEGDYLHGQLMDEQVRFYGPQVRLLAQEGFFEGEDFTAYIRALDPSQRLQLFMDINTGIADLCDERLALVARMAEELADVSPDDLSPVDSFTYASLLAMKKDSIAHLEKALQAARRSAAADYPSSGQLVSAISAVLGALYLKKGKRAAAEALRQEQVRSGGATAKERFTALQPLLMQAVAKARFFQKKKASALLDQYFEAYYEIVDSLEPAPESFSARFSSSQGMILALNSLLDEKRYDRLLEEVARFLPSMQLFCRADGFFNRAAPLEIFVYFHTVVIAAVQGLFPGYRPMEEEGVPLQRMGDLALLCLAEGVLLLKDVDPESKAIAQLRGQLRGIRYDNPALIRQWLDVTDIPLKEMDELIEEQYFIYRKKLC